MTRCNKTRNTGTDVRSEISCAGARATAASGCANGLPVLLPRAERLRRVASLLTPQTSGAEATEARRETGGKNRSALLRVGPAR
jgi:hypothetical protein